MNTAVFAGRFALLTRAHLATADAVLRRWPRLVIAVLDLDVTPDPPPDLAARHPEFYRLCAANHDPVNNPFTAAERVRMWRVALANAGHGPNAEAIEAVRPELDPEGFNRRFPPGRFDLITVAPAPDCSRFDHIRTAVFVEILRREVTEITPPLIEHTSSIMHRINDGASWASFLPPGVDRIFDEIDGPARMRPRLHQAQVRR